ncbi:MAG: HK97 gp10 family phage protein [Dehalococcoidia bacterium]|jgi:hypothetical protein
MSDNFTVPISEVSANLNKILDRTIPSIATEALYEMAKQVVNDAVNVEPKVPVGHYRAKAGKRTGVGGQLKQSWKIEKTKDGMITVGFNMPYATYQHEGQRSDGSRVIRNWTEPGAGKKFLGNKLSMFKDIYLKRMADFIKSRSE